MLIVFREKEMTSQEGLGKEPLSNQEQIVPVRGFLFYTFMVE